MWSRVLSVVLTIALVSTMTVILPASAYAEPASQQSDLTAATTPVQLGAASEDPALQENLSLESKAVDYDTLKRSVDVITKAIKESPEIFGGEEVKSYVAVFTGVVGVASKVSTVFGAFSSAMTFLKLVGLVEDANAKNMANILTRLEEISEKIQEMDEKLNVITQEMAKIQASLEFNARSQKATSMLSNWNSFSYRYMEDGMDKLMTQYTAMQREGLKAWCENKTDAGRVGVLDNTKVILGYLEVDGSWQLQYVMSDEVPAEYKAAGARYIVLPEEVLPSSVAWDVNTYRTKLETAIGEGIRAFAGNNGNAMAAFDSYGFDSADMTDSLSQQLAKDAVDVLIARVGYNKVNENPSFPLEVKRQFQNYTAHLLGTEDGIDALIKTYYLTHAFEGEIKDELPELCNNMIVKTGVYGTFAMNILGMSNDIENSELEAALSYYCQAVEKLDAVKGDCLTGHDNYCYLTNSLVVFPNVTITTTATVHTQYDNSANKYMWYTASQPRVEFQRYYSTNLIGDAKALLMLYTLQSNGKTLNTQFIRDTLGLYRSSYAIPLAITSYTDDTDFSVGSSQDMLVRKVIGSWFPGDQIIKMSNRPGKATSDYYVHHRMAKGTVVDLVGGGLQTETPLSTLAIYGESHAYWWNDEAAFLGGPAYVGDFSSSVQKVQTKAGGAFEYDNKYTQTIYYSSITTEPLPLSASYGGTRASYAALSDELSEDSIIEQHEWDGGVETLAPTCEEPGIMTYTALDDSSLKYTREIPATGHNWDEGVITYEPGATDDEKPKTILTRTCLNDPSHVYTEYVEPAGTVDMHRLYNPNSGEHFYTADEQERDALVGLGWKYEGIGWTAPTESSTPVYRLYNEFGSEHHYTTSADEKDALVGAGWKDEGVGWYSDDAQTVPLYRDYNPNAFANNHNYTADKEEHDYLLSIGWKDEGIGWYGVN